MKTSINNTLFAVLIFSIAMGFMEGAVVVYLRDIYYPEGFKFPLVPISKLHSIVELIREAATIIMLIAIGWLAGNTPVKRFAYFLAAFAIWDLTYYIALKLVLDWPASILEWDILFLIPIPWFGPVVTPCIVSAMMLFLAALLLRAPETNGKTIIDKLSWTLLISGSVTVIASFVVEYIQYTVSVMDTAVDNNLMLEELSKFVPGQFNWLLFAAGCAIILSGIFRIQYAIGRLSTNARESTEINSSLI